MEFNKLLDYAKNREEICRANDTIAPEMYGYYGVKRGLRDENGNGVLAGLTNISKVIAFDYPNGVKTPCDGKLWYRGYRVEKLLKDLGEESFGYEKIAYLLLMGDIPTEAELADFRKTIADCRSLPSNFTRDVIMKAPSGDIMNSMTRSILTLASYDDHIGNASVANSLRQCIQLIAEFPLLAVYAYHAYNYSENDESMVIHRPDPNLSTAENFLMMLRPDKKYTKTEAKVLDTALILHMEHGGGNNSTFSVPIFFLLILLLKVFSMSFTNAGGGVGGTFGPTLFIGAIAGFVVSRTINLIGGPALVPEQNFVLVGMAGLMAGVMQAPMTAIFLIAEISGGYELLIPLILTATISYGVTRMVEPYSIYTKRIAKKGELLTHDSDQAVLTLLKTNDLVEADFGTIRIDATLGELVQVVAESNRNIFPVVDSRNHFQGYVSLEDIRRDMFTVELYNTQHVYNYMKSAPAYVYVDEKMDSVMKKFEVTGAWNLPVVEHDRTYLGFVSKSKIFSAYRTQLKQVSHD